MSEVPPDDAPAAVRQRLARLLDPGAVSVAPAVRVPAAAPRPLGAAGDSGGVPARLGRVGAFDPGRPGLRALAVVAVAVAVGAAVLAWLSRPRPEPVPPRPTVTEAPPPSSTEPAELVVAVSGKVHEPGLVRLPAGARVADAIAAAGGALPAAELDHLNLARKISDGELIAVGIPPPPDVPAGAGTEPAGGGGKVNLNTATAAQLESLPGVGPVLAQRIVDYRDRHGAFTSVGELRNVSGIGDTRLADIEGRVTV